MGALFYGRFGAGAGIVRRFSTHRCIGGWLGTAAGVGWRCNAAVGHGRAGAVVVVRGRNEKRFLPGLATVTAAQDPADVAERQPALVVEAFVLCQSRTPLRLHLLSANHREGQARVATITPT